MSIQKDAQSRVASANAAVLSELPFANRQDYVDAERGFIATLPDATIQNEAGRQVWSVADYGFLKDEEAPATVNPSLWRQSQLNCRHGLFEVIPGIYQIRGFDISNMTLIEGRTGVIVIDPLVSAETAQASVELYFQHRGKRPVAAVIYTHSHTDHCLQKLRSAADAGDPLNLTIFGRRVISHATRHAATRFGGRVEQLRLGALPNERATVARRRQKIYY
jgi:alkyl sulfatase BDS1-like metallo-beta-lactamase superfamily hydrolase